MQKIDNIIIGSQGYAFGKVFIIHESKRKEYVSILKQNISKELERFYHARKETIVQLKNLIREVKERLGEEHAEIFEGHLAIFEDDEFDEGIASRIREKLYSAEHATEEFISENCSEMMQLGEYFRERANDFKDLGNRLIAVLENRHFNPLLHLKEQCIIVAHELTPSMTSQMDAKNVLGFITEVGGATSHVAFIAQNLEIPALVGCKGICDTLQKDSTVIIDAMEGVLIIEPDEMCKQSFLEKEKKHNFEFQKLLSHAGEPAVTRDGKVVSVYANIGSESDVLGAMKNGADGVGLFRTEFLFMGDTPPSEEKQFITYKNIVQNFSDKPVVIRTLDVGGDKEISYLKLPKGSNPFLGYRALRMYTEHIKIIQQQLRAILRASAFGTIKIMVPMVISLKEFIWFKNLVQDVQLSLLEHGHKVGEYSIGLMIETPAAAVLSNVFATHADFFSIGSNDLTQYVLAVDRGEQIISDLYQPFHPAVLRLIHKIIRSGNETDIEVSICGDLGGNEKAVPLLVGFGIRGISVSANKIPLVKNIIRKLHYEKLQDDLALLKMIGNITDTINFLNGIHRKYISENSP